MRDFFIALHSLVLMCHLDRQINSSELAENICVNPVQVRRALAPLVCAGILQITEGRFGGYRLAVGCDEISLAEVAKLSNADFLSGMWHTGNEDENCCISAGMGAYLKNLYEQLSAALLAELADITPRQVEQMLKQAKMLETREVTHEQ